jgi:hypothetical protein
MMGRKLLLDNSMIVLKSVKYHKIMDCDSECCIRLFGIDIDHRHIGNVIYIIK